MTVAALDRRESVRREYVASAVITLFGIQVFSKSGVGNGNIRIEEIGPRQGGTVAITLPLDRRANRRTRQRRLAAAGRAGE